MRKQQEFKLYFEELQGVTINGFSKNYLKKYCVDYYKFNWNMFFYRHIIEPIKILYGAYLELIRGNITFFLKKY